VSSKTLGGAWALDGIWHRLGLDDLVRTALRGRRCDPVAVERVLFALVANRALDPGSKLAATRWVDKDAHVPGLPVPDEDASPTGRWTCCWRLRRSWLSRSRGVGNAAVTSRNAVS